ncbi:hypothetical protein BJX66DRAFT_346426 [Aspergillus keveii]|uniref:BTB domain-containing protein n=1 Tax=Aspergillus keveii TaxID=714993 RepID=A0ABR4FVJ5_9EURO
MSGKPSDCIVQLQVGERHFTTSRSTLIEESTYFESLLSGRWNTAREDGSYFVDADPDLFVHILRYLRRRVLPDVRFFGISALETYLAERNYIDRVKVCRWVADTGDGSLHTRDDSSLSVEYHTHWVNLGEVYVCPRRLAAHRGHSEKCGRRCDSAKADGMYTYEEEHGVRVFAVYTRVTIAE